LAALLLDAASCLAVDIEDQAVVATRANAELNGLAGRLDIQPGSIEAGPEAGPFDIVLANINAAAITALATSIAERTAPGGTIFAGGIIEERLEAPRRALEAAGFRIVAVKAEGDWRTIVATLPGPGA